MDSCSTPASRYKTWNHHQTQLRNGTVSGHDFSRAEKEAARSTFLAAAGPLAEALRAGAGSPTTAPMQRSVPPPDGRPMQGLLWLEWTGLKEPQKDRQASSLKIRLMSRCSDFSGMAVNSLKQ